MNSVTLENLLRCICQEKAISHQVLAKDELNEITKSRYPTAIIFNSGNRSKGIHWLAAYYTRIGETQFLEIFDPLGKPLQDHGVTFPDKPTFENLVKVQSSTSSLCAEYCLAYVYYRTKGYSVSSILSMFSKDQDVNDKMVALFGQKLKKSCINLYVCRQPTMYCCNRQ